MKDKIQAAFSAVQAEQSLKERTTAALEQTIHAPARRNVLRRRWIPVLTACLLVVLTGAWGYQAYFTPTTVISIDINPSLELSVNRFDRVIAAEGYNDEGQELADSLSLPFADYTDVYAQILENQTIARYLAQDEMLSVTVVSSDADQRQQILTAIESCSAGHANIHCSSLSEEEAASAHECGLSYGKYQAYLAVQALDPSISPEQIRHMSMREIRALIAALSAGEEVDGQPPNAGSPGHRYTGGHGGGHHGG